MQTPTKQTTKRFSISLPIDLANIVCQNATENERTLNREIVRMLKRVVKQEQQSV